MPGTLLIHPDITALADFVRNNHPDFPTVIATNLLSMRFVRKVSGGDLRTTTLKQLSNRMLSRQGIRVLSPFEKRKILQQVVENTSLQYLPVSRPTLRQLGKIFSELMHAATPPEKPLTVARTPREVDVAVTYQAYLQHLFAHKLADPAAVEFFALSCPPEQGKHLIYGYPYFDRAQIELLEKVCLPGSVVTLTSFGHRTLTKARGSRKAFEALGWQVVQAPDAARSTVGTRAVEHLLNPSGEVPEHITHTACANPEQEVRQVMGHIHHLLTSGTPPEDVVVVVRDEHTHLPLIREISRRYHLPILCGQMLPLHFTHSAKLVLALLKANENNWEHHAALQVLQHPLSRFADEVALKRKTLIPPPQALEAWQLEGDFRALHLPLKADGNVYAEKIRLALAFLGVDRTVRGTHQTVMAVRRVLDVLESLTLLKETTLAELQLELTEDFLDIGVPTVYSQRGVRVASPLALSGRKYPHVFVLGLSDTVFPQRPSADVLLDDHIRERWEKAGVDLVRQGERMHVERAYLHACLNAAIDHLHLFRPLFDLKGKALEASPLIRMFQSAPALPEPLPVTEIEKGLKGNVSEEVLQKAERERTRQEHLLSEHHGELFVDLPENHVWSPSQLVKFGQCRFQWLAYKAMNLQPFPEVPTTLERTTEGTCYHKVLEELLNPHLGQQVHKGQLLQELPAAFERAERALQESGDLPPLPHWRFQRAELHSHLKHFVESPEFLQEHSVPVALEFPIQHTLQLSKGNFTYGGIIDRMERQGEDLQIIDYKRHKYISEIEGPEGKKLEIQLPLYLMATGAQEGRYLSVLDRKKRVIRAVGPAKNSKKYQWEEHRKQVLDFLEDTQTHALQNDFQPTPSNGACHFCEYGSLCRVKA